MENRSEYWNPHTLLYRFLAEARRLWELEATVPCITTIQAGVVFSVVHNLCGLDEIGQAYRINSIALAHQLRLFEPIYDTNDRTRSGKIYTAWMLFCWEALVAFSFMQPPLLEDPLPMLPPSPVKDPGWYGEVWLKYPSSPTLLPLHFAHVFESRARFRIIMNRFCTAAYTDPGGVGVPLEEAYALHTELAKWYQDLPEPLHPRNIVLPAHLQLHMYYHHLHLTIFEPLLNTHTTIEPSPQKIVAESYRRLQTLFRLYYLRHGYEAMDLFIVIPLMFTGVKCLDAIDDNAPPAELETLRATLVLVASGLYTQRKNHYLAEALYRVVRARMRPQEAELLKMAADLDDEKGVQQQQLKHKVRSHWPVSVIKRKEDLDSQILANLVKSLHVHA
ncbi:hypothetical protein ANO11243_009730 [Dothideomycetidae sp. 11243]|nr:hypothetical protein ANO11243_009730 [fungal sp. No.11243]